MTLITAVVAGLACGYFLGLRPKAFVVWLAVWAVVLVIQTIVLLKDGAFQWSDWSYWPVQAVILVLAMVMIWSGAKLRARRTHAG